MIASRYLCALLIRRWLAVLALFLGAATLIDAAETLRALSGQTDSALLVQLLAARAVVLLGWVWPSAFFIACAAAGYRLAVRREWIAMESLGAPVRWLFTRWLAVALAAGGCGFVFDELAVTRAVSVLDQLETRALGRFTQGWSRFHRPMRWFREGDWLIYADRLRSGQTAEQVSVWKLRGSSILWRADASSMTEEAPRRWRLRNPSVWCAALPAGPGQDAGFAGGRGGCAQPEMAGLEDDRSRDRLVELPVAMKDLRIAAGRPAAHRLADLPGLIHARSARGLETIPWRLALQERLARIFLPAAWLCLAAAFFWRRFVRPSPLEWAGFALGAAGCGAVIQFVLASSAQAGWLPPASAVWLMPLLLVLAGWAVARIPVR